MIKPPASTVAIAEIIGLPGAVKLARAVPEYAKSRLYIPQGPMPDGHSIVKAVGRAEATALQKEFGGMWIACANLEQSKRLLRAKKKRLAIKAAIDAGESNKDIAERLQCSPSYVSRVRITGGKGSSKAARDKSLRVFRRKKYSVSIMESK